MSASAPASDRETATVTGRNALLRLALGSAITSAGPVLVGIVDVPPTVSAFYRMVIGGAVLLTIALARGQRILAGRRLMLILGLAGVASALDMTLWHRSIVYIGPGLAALLGNLQVFGLAIVGVLFLGERLRATLVVSILIAVLGLVLLVGIDWSVFSSNYRWGLIFGLLTIVVYTAYILCLRAARKARPDISPVRDLAIASVFAALVLGAISAIEGASLAIPSAGQGGLLAAYALGSQVIGWVLITSALAHVPASLVGLVMLLQPALALVWDILFFDRSMSARELAGVLLVLAAIYLGARARE